MVDQDGRWRLISVGRESRMHFGRGGLQVNEPYNWEGGLIIGRGGLETAVYGTWRMRVKNVCIYFVFFFFPVSRGLY